MFKLTKRAQARIQHRTVAMYHSLSRHLPPSIKSGGKCAPPCLPIINHSSPPYSSLATSVNSNTRGIDIRLEFINGSTKLFEIFDCPRFHFFDSEPAQMNNGDTHPNRFLFSERSTSSVFKPVPLLPQKRSSIDTTWRSLFLHKRLNFVTRKGKKIFYQLEQGFKKLSPIYIENRTGSLLLKFGHKDATYLNNKFGLKSHDPYLGTTNLHHWQFLFKYAKDSLGKLCFARSTEVRKLRFPTSMFSTQDLMHFRNKECNSYLLRLQKFFHIFHHMVSSPIFIKQGHRTLWFQSYKPSHYYK